jgi:ubiquitin C-terminal hydrolase
VNLFKKLEVFVDWNEAESYQEAEIRQDITYLKLKKQEKEIMSGVPLAQCLDLYSKKEKVEGFQCDTCKENTTALIKPLVSHLPDILILHLSRFNF